MRQAEVLYKNNLAGLLTQLDNGSFVFRYQDTWFNDSRKPSVSLTLPKNKQQYESDFLFPFFYNMLPEGSNRQLVCFEFRIDASDNFGLLLTTAKFDTIGAIKIKKVETK